MSQMAGVGLNQRRAAACGNNRISSRNFGLRAYSLVEMLVYIAAAFVVLELAYAAMYRSMDAAKALRRNADDISRSLQAGERWRADVRGAIQPIRLEAAGEETIFHLPQAAAEEIDWRVAGNSVSRRTGNGSWSVFLDDVKNSNIILDSRGNVSAWRWELELQPHRKQIGRTRPLFTFIAAPAASPSR